MPQTLYPPIEPPLSEPDPAFSLKSPTVIRLHESTIGKEEIAAALEVLESGNLTAGDRVREFEARLGDMAVMVNSGSSANLLAVAALVECGHLRRGDEVIVPALAWSTTIWPLVQYGLIPKIVDIDPETLNIDPEAALDAIGPKTKGAMLVHTYGNPVDEALLKTLCDKEIVIIEDCCEAHGAYHNKKVGRYGHISTLSFYFSHEMTTAGEGGAAITQDEELHEAMMILRAHGWTRDIANVRQKEYARRSQGIDPRFLFVGTGYNLRPTELAAAMGLVQLNRLPAFIASRHLAAGLMHEVVSRHTWLASQKYVDGRSWFGFPLIARAYHPLKKVRLHLENNGIETRALLAGNIARQPGIRRYRHEIHGDLGNADYVMRQGFSIGCHQAVTQQDTAILDGILGALDP